MSETPVTTNTPNSNANEPGRSPLKLVAVIGILLIALLIFGAMDS